MRKVFQSPDTGLYGVSCDGTIEHAAELTRALAYGLVRAYDNGVQTYAAALIWIERDERERNARFCFISTIAQTIDKYEQLGSDKLHQKLRDAFPGGEFDTWQYEVWLVEICNQLDIESVPDVQFSFLEEK